MIVAIHQPNYLPYLGFFHKALNAEKLILYDTAQFSKNSFQNRNRIKTSKGPGWLTVPVHRPGRKPVREVIIDSSRPWARAHVDTLSANYARSEHYDRYPEIAAILTEPQTHLAPLCIRLIQHLLAVLGIDTEVVMASDLDVSPDGSATERLVRMVHAVGGTAYLSGIGGRDYLDESGFGDIRLEYQEFRHPIYPQLFGEFETNLSVVDALFNVGADEVSHLLQVS